MYKRQAIKLNGASGSCKDSMMSFRLGKRRRLAMLFRRQFMRTATLPPFPGRAVQWSHKTTSNPKPPPSPDPYLPSLQQINTLPAAKRLNQWHIHLHLSNTTHLSIWLSPPQRSLPLSKDNNIRYSLPNGIAWMTSQVQKVQSGQLKITHTHKCCCTYLMPWSTPAWW